MYLFQCDQSKPACSRCTRLQIVCIGSGQQRYKFLEEDGVSNSFAKQLTIHSRRSTPDSQRRGAPKSLSRTPSNESSLLSRALIAKLQAKDDLRYHLTWTYGGFLEDLPRRLGTNAALDTAVDALVCAHSHFGSLDISLPDSESLSKYTRAVTTLRVCLNDPIKAREANTLCAIMLLLIVQTFIGVNVDSSSAHIEGAAMILKARGYYDPQDEFEQMLVLCLRGPVLFEGLVNSSSKVRFTLEEWKFLVENDLKGAGSRNSLMGCLAHAPIIMHRGRAALKTGSNVTDLVDEAGHQYAVLKSLVNNLRIAYDKVRHTQAGSMILHAERQRVYGLSLAIVLIFNCVLSALDPHNIDMALDAAEFTEAVFVLSEEAAPYRPLGSAYLTLCLIAAWCACRDGTMRLMLEGALMDYRRDFPVSFPDPLDIELEKGRRSLYLLD